MLIENLNTPTILFDSFPNTIQLNSKSKLKRYNYTRLNFVCYMTGITGKKRALTETEKDDVIETENLNPHEPPKKKQKLKYVLHKYIIL